MRYSEVAHNVGRFGAGLSEIIGERLCGTRGIVFGILASVSLQWFVVDFACTLKCNPLVVMHRATNYEQLAHILDESGLVVLVASKHLSGLVSRAVKLTKATELQHVVWIDDMPDAYALQAGNLPIGATAMQSLAPGISVLQHSWDTVLEQGADARASGQQGFVFASPETLVKLLPSSGSTGLPKLAAITESALFKVGSCSRIQPSIEVVAYAYEAIRQTHDVLLQGGRIGVFSGSLDRMLDDVQILRPTAFAATPTFWNGLYNQFEQEVIEQQRQRESEGVSTDGNRGRLLQAWIDRKVLGNRIVALISTGAPLRHEVQRWLVRVFGRTVVNAYGTTETGGLSSNSSTRDGVELRLRDVPEMGYLTSDRPNPRGEILARTTRMTCYFRRSDLRQDGTMAASVDTDQSAWITLGGVRYFRTGDVGELVAPGQVRVIDRCKNHFKLAQGVYVAPETIEGIFMNCKFVRQVFVWGCSFMQALVAVVVPSQALLMELGHHTTDAMRSSLEDASLLQQAQQLVLRSLQQLCREHGLKPWETPQFILLEGKSFSMEDGLLTSSGKLCRAALIQRYRHRMTNKVEEPNSDIHGNAEEIGGLCAGLREVLNEFSSARHFSAEDKILSLGLDSLGIVRFSARLSKRFGLEIPAGTIFLLDTFQDLERVLFGGNAALRHAVGRCKIIDWGAEASSALVDLQSDLKKQIGDCMECMSTEAGNTGSSNATVLLTGATGFLGAFILAALMENSRAQRIVVLVRASSQRIAQKRLAETMTFYMLMSEADVASSVEVLATAGIEEEFLGLSPAVYQDVAQGVGSIFHCAAHVSSGLPYSALRSGNVVGTRRCVELALRAGAKFIHISTLGFLDGGHPESTLVSPISLAGKSGYAQSKWVAEQLVWQAQEHLGLQALVFRPGAICGDPSSGASNPKDAVSIIICGLLRLGCISVDPRSPLPLSFNLVPVNYVAAAVVCISLQDDTWVRLPYHLCASTSILLPTIAIWMRDAGHALEEVPPEVFCARVRQVIETHPLFLLKPQLSQCRPVGGQLSAEPVANNAVRVLRLGPLPPRDLTQPAFTKSLEFLLRVARQ